ncbi:hypothetical protein LIER_12990 [Lithospermum erythrorhizon]|uniref:Uncharacterized protein n=1 Tax=Lithospermum erythrorhizon TaxID=34254 RepID=A0AAV3PV96_LITER
MSPSQNSSSNTSISSYMDLKNTGGHMPVVMSHTLPCTESICKCSFHGGGVILLRYIEGIPLQAWGPNMSSFLFLLLNGRPQSFTIDVSAEKFLSYALTAG